MLSLTPSEASRTRPSLARCGIGVLLPLATLGMLEGFSWLGLGIPNPPAVLLLAVGLAAFSAGPCAGLSSSGIAWLYVALFFSLPGHPFHYTDENLRRVIVWAIATPALALMVGILKLRSEEHQGTKAQLAAIVDSSDDAVIMTDVDGTIITWNRGAERLYGYAAGEATGQSIAMLLPPERHQELLQILKHARRGDRIDQFEAVCVRKDRSRIEASLSVSPVRDPEGTITSIAAIARNTDRLRRLAQDARREAETLRHIAALSRAAVQEITASLEIVKGRLLSLSKRADDDPLTHEAIQQVCTAVERIHEVVGQMERIIRLDIVNHAPEPSLMLDRRASRPERVSSVTP